MPRASLQALPAELQSSICSDLDYVTLAALELTCRSVRPTASLYKRKCIESRTKKSILVADLVEIENWECHTSRAISRVDPTHEEETNNEKPITGRDYFACSCCLKIRCASKFSNPMMSGRREKTRTSFTPPPRMNKLYPPGTSDYEKLLDWMDGSTTSFNPGDPGSIPRDVYRAPLVAPRCGNALMRRYGTAKCIPRGDKLSRTCIDCGVLYRHYKPGKVLAYGGAELPDNSGGGYGVVCATCGLFRRLDIKMKSKGYRRRNCNECLQRKRKSKGTE